MPNGRGIIRTSVVKLAPGSAATWIAFTDCTPMDRITFGVALAISYLTTSNALVRTCSLADFSFQHATLPERLHEFHGSPRELCQPPFWLGSPQSRRSCHSGGMVQLSGPILPYVFRGHSLCSQCLLLSLSMGCCSTYSIIINRCTPPFHPSAPGSPLISIGHFTTTDSTSFPSSPALP